MLNKETILEFLLNRESLGAVSPVETAGLPQRHRVPDAEQLPTFFSLGLGIKGAWGGFRPEKGRDALTATGQGSPGLYLSWSTPRLSSSPSVPN